MTCCLSVKFQVNPTTLLLPSRLDDLEKLPTTDGNDEAQPSYHLQIRPINEFSYQTARSKLIALRIGEDHGPDIQVPADLHDVFSDGGQSRGNLLKLAAWIDIDSRITVGCAGAVLAYLQRKKAIEEGANREGVLAIQSVEMFSLQNVM
jgi:DNA mismatch repair protein MSH5